MANVYVLRRIKKGLSDRHRHIYLWPLCARDAKSSFVVAYLIDSEVDEQGEGVVGVRVRGRRHPESAARAEHDRDRRGRDRRRNPVGGGRADRNLLRLESLEAVPDLVQSVLLVLVLLGRRRLDIARGWNKSILLGLLLEQ